MSDDELLAAFERLSLPKQQWTHRAHVRVAFLYQSRYRFEAALSRMRSSIQAYNAVYGVDDGPQSGYHETTTCAFMQLIHQAARQRGPFADSYQFCEHSPELLDRRVLLCYYTRDRILGLDAKAAFLPPDIASLDRVGLAFPEYGGWLEGVEYTLRPGGYGVIRDDAGRIAVAVTPTGTYLPGGGQEPEESAAETLAREALEECGLTIQIESPLGVADEFVFAHEEHQHFCKRCTFYAGRAIASGPSSEPDHQLRWLALDEALAQLSHGSQRWAVSRMQHRLSYGVR